MSVNLPAQNFVAAFPLALCQVFFLFLCCREIGIEGLEPMLCFDILCNIFQRLALCDA